MKHDSLPFTAHSIDQSSWWMSCHIDQFSWGMSCRIDQFSWGMRHSTDLMREIPQEISVLCLIPHDALSPAGVHSVPETSHDPLNWHYSDSLSKSWVDKSLVSSNHMAVNILSLCSRTWSKGSTCYTWWGRGKPLESPPEGQYMVHVSDEDVER